MVDNVDSNPIKGSCCFLEQETLSSLLKNSSNEVIDLSTFGEQWILDNAQPLHQWYFLLNVILITNSFRSHGCR